MPNSVGAIYGLLFASPEPLCFADIVERLDMSKGSVSQGLAFLRQSGAVKLVELADDRREFFEPELGLRRLASGLIQEKIQPLAKETRGAVARLKQHAETAQGEQNEFQMERIKQLETWHKQLGRVLPVVQTILKIPRPESLSHGFRVFCVFRGSLLCSLSTAHRLRVGQRARTRRFSRSASISLRQAYGRRELAAYLRPPVTASTVDVSIILRDRFHLR